MKPLQLDILRQAVREGRVEWRKHVLQQLAERAIPQQAVLDTLLTGERIRDYTEDRPFPRALFLSYVAAQPLHVVAACDETDQRAFIITAYLPSLDVFEPDYRTKKKNE